MNLESRRLAAFRDASDPGPLCRGGASISGGGATVLRYLDAGLVDELLLSLAPTFLGGGIRLFEGIDKSVVDVSIMAVLSSPEVTHLRFALKKKR